MPELNLRELDSQIARRRAELTELEAAARVLRRCLVSDRPDVAVPGLDCWGLCVREVSLRILSEHAGEWMSYRDVARSAIDRGYRSRKPDSTEEKTMRSFHSIMRLMPELEQDGSRFRLVP